MADGSDGGEIERVCGGHGCPVAAEAVARRGCRVVGHFGRMAAFPVVSLLIQMAFTLNKSILIFFEAFESWTDLV